MFQQLDPTKQSASIEICLDGVMVNVPAGASLASALLYDDNFPMRTTPIGDKQRAPYCMMGVCFDCLVEIDGVPNQQSCLVAVRAGMVVNRQKGAADIEHAAVATKGDQHD